MNLRAAAARVGQSLLAAYLRTTHSSLQGGGSPSQSHLLRELLQGSTLKSHRYLDGGKEFRLRSLSGEETQVPAQEVHRLEERGLILSNQKFPAATFFLSQRGRDLAANGMDAAGPLPSRKITTTTRRD